MSYLLLAVVMWPVVIKQVVVVPSSVSERFMNLFPQGESHMRRSISFYCDIFVGSHREGHGCRYHWSTDSASSQGGSRPGCGKLGILHRNGIHRAGLLAKPAGYAGVAATEKRLADGVPGA